jgi:hypothetical protein
MRSKDAGCSGGAYFVAGVFADVGDIPINRCRHLLAIQIRLYGMTNHPPTGRRAAPSPAPGRP